MKSPASGSSTSHDTLGNRHKRTRSPGKTSIPKKKTREGGSPGKTNIRRKMTRGGAKNINFADPFAVPNLLEELDSGKYGSDAAAIKDLLERRRQLLDTDSVHHSSLPETEQCLALVSNKVNQPGTPSATPEVIDIDAAATKPLTSYEDVVLNKPPGEHNHMKNFLEKDYHPKEASPADEDGRVRGKGEYVGVENDVASKEGNEQLEAEIENLDDVGVVGDVASEEGSKVKDCSDLFLGGGPKLYEDYETFSKWYDAGDVRTKF